MNKILSSLLATAIVFTCLSGQPRRLVEEVYDLGKIPVDTATRFVLQLFRAQLKVID